MAVMFETLLNVLALFVFCGWCFQWFVHVVAILYGKYRLHGPAGASARSSVGSVEECPVNPAAAQSDGTTHPGVSIVKPLKGVDANLFRNLETFFNIDYPLYELLFCVEDSFDPAIMIVQSLIDRYPKVDAKLFIGSTRVGVNPKVQNMLKAYNSSKYQFVLISDSGLKIKADTLSHMVSSFSTTTGLVHQLPFTCHGQGFAGVLEQVYFGTQCAKMYLSADLYGLNCVTGMSTLFRKHVVQEAGGLESLGGFLAEDFHLGQIFINRGWKVHICRDPALQSSANSSLYHFNARMTRWRRLRLSLIPFTAIFLEPVSESVLLGLITSWAVTILFSWSGVAFFLVHMLVWFLLDYILLLVVQGGPLPFTKLEFLIVWLFREFTSLPLMLRAHTSNTVTWRDKKFTIRPGGVGEEVCMSEVPVSV